MSSENDGSKEGDERPPSSLGGQAAVAGGAALVAAASIPGPAGAAIGAAATVYALAGLEKLTAIWGARSRNNAQQVLDISAQTIGSMTAVELVEHIRGDPERERLLAMAAIAGSETVLMGKIRALGKALADGVLAQDDAKVDEQAMILAALNDIEAPHVKVISMMFNNREPGPPDGWFREYVYRPWQRRDFQRDPSFGITLRPILATLERHAVVVNWSTDHQKRLSMLRRNPTESAIPDSIKKWTEEAHQLGVAWVLSEMGVRVHDYLLESSAGLPSAIDS